MKRFGRLAVVARFVLSATNPDGLFAMTQLAAPRTATQAACAGSTVSPCQPPCADAATSAGLPREKAARTGAGRKLIFAGLLECAHCGGSMAVVNADRYGRSAHSDGRACDNGATFSRTVIERGLLAGIQTRLRRPELVEEARRRIVAALGKANSATAKSSHERVSQLEAEVARIVEAIAGGALRASPALTQRLLAAESELQGIRAPVQTTPTIDPAEMTPRIVDRYLSAIDRLPELLNATSPDRAREELRRLIGPIEVEADATEIRFRT